MTTSHGMSLTVCGAALLLSQACRSDVVTPDYDAGAIIFGSVSTAAGEPIPYADLKVVAIEGRDCGGSLHELLPTVTTDAAGAYRERFHTLVDGPFEGCVEVQLRPAAGSGFAPRTVRGGAVRFVASPPFDSLRVDVVY